MAEYSEKIEKTETGLATSTCLQNKFVLTILQALFSSTDAEIPSVNNCHQVKGWLKVPIAKRDSLHQGL